MNYRRNSLLVLAATAIAGLLITSLGCGSGSSSTTTSVTTSGQNVAPISVNGGPNGNLANGLFVSVTVCVPSTSTCQSIPNVLVDTGSSGLRILSSVTTISLPQQTGSGGPVAECLPFISGFTWGPVQTADVQISGEKASAVPIQSISGTAFPVPTACSNHGGPAMDSVQMLLANGILGVGLAGPDCFACSPNSGLANPNLYFGCPTSGCQPITQALTNQVQNPVALFPTDNNGVIVELPALNNPAPSATGSLVFGIGTQSNNALNQSTVYTVDQFGNFTTTFNGKSYPSSFIDSGSDGYFFLNTALTGIPVCTDNNSFYCPTSTDNLSATNQGANGASGTFNFSVANADSLFTGGNFAFPNLGGPTGAGDFFDWGLPFFFGRNVFVAIDGKSTPGGSGPFWAY